MRQIRQQMPSSDGGRARQKWRVAPLENDVENGIEGTVAVAKFGRLQMPRRIRDRRVREQKARETDRAVLVVIGQP
jgi:hypothetical protein